MIRKSKITKSKTSESYNCRDIIDTSRGFHLTHLGGKKTYSLIP